MEYDVLVICFVEFFGVLDYFFFVCFDFCFFFSVEVDVVWGVSGQKNVVFFCYVFDFFCQFWGNVDIFYEFKFYSI